MLLLGHIGIGAFLASMIFLPILGGVIGVLLPDVIDKGVFILGYAPCSRFLAHSIFFIPVAGLVAYTITRNKKFAIAVALGVTLHLVQDLNGDVPFLYPLKTYSYFETCGHIQIAFTPFIIATEIIGASLLIFMAMFSARFKSLRSWVWKMMKNIGLNRK